jgi:serine/threonine protein phosphatase 1
MFAKLFRRRQRGAAPETPDGTRAYAVGDIHGRADLLERLHSLILRDALDFEGPRKVVVYLGDYVDRGHESRAVIDRLLDEPLPGFESVYLKGNHEQTLLDFLEDFQVALDWMSFGGGATLGSYGVGLDGSRANAEALTRMQQKFHDNLPERHREFFNSLGLMHREGDYLFAHAGIRHGVPLEQQVPADLLWIRDEFLSHDPGSGPTVVHGHTITPKPMSRPHRIGIDTGAFATGRLTAAVLEGTSQRFLAT